MIAIWVAAALVSQDPVAPTEFVPLFNGKDLSGWKSWLGDTKRDDPRGVFSVQDGMIRISGDGFGYLGTAKRYRDYRLTSEFKWGRKNWRGRENNARDSGIFLHASGPDGNSSDGGGAFRCAVECQVMQGRVGDLMLIRGKDEAGAPIPMKLTARAAAGADPDGWPTWQRDGKPRTLEGHGRLNWFGIDPGWKDALDFRGKNDVESAGEEWTRIECRCEGDRIAVWVNGIQVNEATDVRPKSGAILLQCEGSEIFFRKVDLHPLR